MLKVSKTLFILLHDNLANNYLSLHFNPYKIGNLYIPMYLLIFYFITMNRVDYRRLTVLRDRTMLRKLMRYNIIIITTTVQ